MQPDVHPTKRTQWAERHVEEFLALPLVREFVLRSPQTVDGTQREVADHLILHSRSGVLISQKCQEDPAARDEEKTELWARKNARNAVRQLCGALRADPKMVWCDHPRRGRIEFPKGLPPITHGIVLTEVFQAVDLQAAADDLPLGYRNTPITYLSVNDFLNLAVELRTVPELIAYLDARRGLPIPELRRIGSEQPLFEFYLLGDGSFQGCAGISDARVAVAAQEGRLRELPRDGLYDSFRFGARPEPSYCDFRARMSIAGLVQRDETAGFRLVSASSKVINRA